MDRDIVAQAAEEMMQNETSSHDYYFNYYAEEFEELRWSLHDEITSEIFGKDYSAGKTIFMLGGAPANGKSSFLSAGEITYPANALRLDPDEFKSKLPEYEIMKSQSFSNAAALVHEESGILARHVRTMAVERDLDIIIDGVANDTLDKRMEDVELLRSSGHKIRIDYVSLDTSLSIKLAKQRFLQTGRQVPETYVKEKNRMISQLVPQLIDNNVFDELYLWDTNIEGEPRLILSHINGNLDIKDKTLYNNFKMKSND